MIVELTVFPETPLYEYRVPLSGREYRIRVDYNGREDRWYLYLLDADGALIAGPMKVVCGRDLLAHDRWKAACPPGQLIALDLAGTVTSPGASPSWADFGRRVRLFYQTADVTIPTTSEQAGGGA